MAENKKSFVLYTDSQGLVNQLPDEVAGRLLKHIYSYVNDENPVSDELLLNIAFEPIKMQLKRDLVKWENQIEQRKQAGKRSAEQRALTKSNERSVPLNEKQRNPTVNDNVSVNVNVNDNVINKRVNKFTAPTLLEVQTYFIENGFNKDLAKRAFDYYDVANWKDSKGNQVKNWKQKMRGVWLKEENKEQQFSKNFQSPFKPIAL
jgi:hypothetical protein